jgi:multiple sugar transport system ATP-binding protein
MPARIEHIEFLGEALLLHARHTGTRAPMIARLDGRERGTFAVDQELCLKPDPARAFLFDSSGKRLRAERMAQTAAEPVHG